MADDSRGGIDTGVEIIRWPFDPTNFIRLDCGAGTGIAFDGSTCPSSLRTKACAVSNDTASIATAGISDGWLTILPGKGSACP